MNECISWFRWTIITFLFEASVFSAFAQNPAGETVIQVGQNIHVSREISDRPLTEPQIAADPKNPNHLLGAAIVASTPSPGAAAEDCAAFVSFDGGKTWSKHEFGVRECVDPWSTISAEG